MTTGDIIRHRAGEKDAELSPEKFGEGEEGNSLRETSSGKMAQVTQEYGTPPYLKVVPELALRFQFLSRSWGRGGGRANL